jgi:hypothetical protein
MKRLVVWLAIGAVLGVLGMLACGPGSEKPPLTPDNVETPAEDAGTG